MTWLRKLFGVIDRDFVETFQSGRCEANFGYLRYSDESPPSEIHVDVGLPETSAGRGTRMTLEELRQKLAVEMLAKTGVGLISENTYREIARLVVPPNQSIPSDMRVEGIRLIPNPFVPDGEIYPFKEWEFSQPQREFPFKEPL